MKKQNQILIGIVLSGLIFISRPMGVMAQDPLEVGPDIYKLVFENERVRVLDAQFKPGSKIAMHSHPDHFAYVLAAGNMRLSYPDGTTKDIEAKAGDVMWVKAETHAGENIGTTDVHLLVVELKEPQPNKGD